MKKIAYLAPELPALSATFVYNELFALREKGYAVFPFSVHAPAARLAEERLASLAKETFCLYGTGIRSFLTAALYLFATSPFRVVRTLGLLAGDLIRVGLFNRTAPGLCYRFLAACRLAIALKDEKCEHLHIHFAHVATDIGMYASSLSAVPFSFTAHANDLFERGWLIPEKINRSSFAATISDYNRRYMISLGGDRNKIHIIRCGIDSRRFAAPVFTSPVSPYTIGAIGRMVEKKGFDILLQAADLLRNEGIAFQLMLVGDGPEEEALHRLSIALGLEEQVNFQGAKSNEEVPGWLKTLDLFVLPCRRDRNGDMDGIPVVLMEAMLSGVPVISTRISGIPELIHHGREGLLVEPDSPVELAKAMARYLRNDTLQQRYRTKAIGKVKDEFDLNVNIERLLQLCSCST